eukprot:11181822-Lingulodinium_polyedra.AAC.1
MCEPKSFPLFFTPNPSKRPWDEEKWKWRLPSNNVLCLHLAAYAGSKQPTNREATNHPTMARDRCRL